MPRHLPLRTSAPTFAELRQIAEQLGVDQTILLVDFGYLNVNDLNEQLRQRYDTYRHAIDIITSMRHDAPQAETEFGQPR